MKFIVSSSILYKELQTLSGVINSSNTIPILDNFLFEVDKNKLTISSSDLESTMTSQIDIESTSNDKIAVSAKLLTDILKTFSEQPLTFIKTENNTIEISASNGKYSLAYLEGEEFPKQVEILDAHETILNSVYLGNAINSTIFASGTDDLRPVMSGVFFQFNSDSLKFVATDAHKLVKFETSEYTANNVSEFIIPKKPLQILKGILQAEDLDLTIQHNDSNAKFTFGKSTITDSKHLKSDVNYYYGNNIVSKKLKLKDSNLQDEKCPICQCNYRNNDLITDLPNCGHTFHSECLFKWLDTNETCPMCISDNLFGRTCSSKRKFDEIVGEDEMFEI